MSREYRAGLSTVENRWHENRCHEFYMAPSAITIDGNGNRWRYGCSHRFPQLFSREKVDRMALS